MSVTEFITRLTIVSAHDLPRTDRLSKIDPYVIILVNGQQYKTAVKDDNENPVWNESFYPRVQKHPQGLLAGNLELQLYDEDTFSDSYVAKYAFDLSSLTPEHLNVPLTFDLEYVKDKYKSQGKKSTITIKVEGLAQSFNSLRAMFSGFPSFLTNDKEHACYVPIPDFGGLIYVGIEYEGSGKIDVKVYVTQAGVPLFLDMLLLSGRQNTKVTSRIHLSGSYLKSCLYTAAVCNIFAVQEVSPLTDERRMWCLPVVTHSTLTEPVSCTVSRQTTRLDGGMDS